MTLLKSQEKMSLNKSNLSFGIDQILCSNTYKTGDKDKSLQVGYEVKCDQNNSFVQNEETSEDGKKL